MACPLFLPDWRDRKIGTGYRSKGKKMTNYPRLLSPPLFFVHMDQQEELLHQVSRNAKSKQNKSN
jgi:hypothetical protein